MATTQQLEKLITIKNIFKAGDSLESFVAEERLNMLITKTEEIIQKRILLREERRKAKLATLQIEETRIALKTLQKPDWMHESVLNQSEKRVKFNINGMIFECSTSILLRDRDSKLGKIALSHDPEVLFYTFDRDWWQFRHILSFLRDGTLPDDRSLLAQLYREAGFWELGQLRTAIEREKLHLHLHKKSTLTVKRDLMRWPEDWEGRAGEDKGSGRRVRKEDKGLVAGVRVDFYHEERKRWYSAVVKKVEMKDKAREGGLWEKEEVVHVEFDDPQTAQWWRKQPSWWLSERKADERPPSPPPSPEKKKEKDDWWTGTSYRGRTFGPDSVYKMNGEKERSGGGGGASEKEGTKEVSGEGTLPHPSDPKKPPIPISPLPHAPPLPVPSTHPPPPSYRYTHDPFSFPSPDPYPAGDWGPGWRDRDWRGGGEGGRFETPLRTDSPLAKHPPLPRHPYFPYPSHLSTSY